MLDGDPKDVDEGDMEGMGGPLKRTVDGDGELGVARPCKRVADDKLDVPARGGVDGTPSCVAGAPKTSSELTCMDDGDERQRPRTTAPESLGHCAAIMNANAPRVPMHGCGQLCLQTCGRCLGSSR